MRHLHLSAQACHDSQHGPALTSFPSLLCGKIYNALVPASDILASSVAIRFIR